VSDRGCMPPGVADVVIPLDELLASYYGRTEGGNVRSGGSCQESRWTRAVVCLRCNWESMSLA
jgi:hypothetical protein